MRKSIALIYASLVALAVSMVAVRSSGQNWTKRTPATSPPARSSYAIAYDAARQRVVLFGGAGVYLPFIHPWEWDGSTWTQHWPLTSPLGRTNHAIAYDAARQRVVLFGGLRGFIVLNDTWEWDGTTWKQQTPATSPPGMGNHAMAYDAVRQRIVLFGRCFNWPPTTWEWDGSTWTRRTTKVSPPDRINHAMVYDAARQRVVLFGGLDFPSLVFFDDTWEWDGSTWTRRLPKVSPPPLTGHAMAYDALRKCTVLFGGLDNQQRILDDTWEWDGSNWKKLAPANKPPAKASYGMAYDAARRRVVFYVSNGSAINETWEYTGTLLLANGTARPGGSVGLALTSPGDEGRPYQVGSSLGTGPIPVDTRKIDLSPDDLLVISTGNRWPWIFSGYQGVVDGKGQASAQISIPNIPALIGTRIHTSFVTLDPASPSGIRAISNTETFTITK